MSPAHRTRADSGDTHSDYKSHCRRDVVLRSHEGDAEFFDSGNRDRANQAPLGLRLQIFEPADGLSCRMAMSDAAQFDERPRLQSPPQDTLVGAISTHDPGDLFDAIDERERRNLVKIGKRNSPRHPLEGLDEVDRPDPRVHPSEEHLVGIIDRGCLFEACKQLFPTLCNTQQPMNPVPVTGVNNTNGVCQSSQTPCWTRDRWASLKSPRRAIGENPWQYPPRARDFRSAC